MVINNVRAEEHRLLRSNIQVESCNVRVLTQRGWSVEAKTGSIQEFAWLAISDSKIVGLVFGCCRGNCLNGSWVFAAGVGKDTGNVSRRQGDDETPRRVRSVREFHQPLAQTRQRYCPGGGGLCTRVAASLVIVEEEEPVLDDGAAQPAAKSVPDERWPRNTDQIIEEVISRSDGIAMRFEEGAMKIVRTALGDQLDLRTGRMARSRICSYSRNPELFNRFGV